MTTEYCLDEIDFLQYQLFAASKSANNKRQRRRSWLIISFSFVLLGLLFASNDKSFLSYYFLFFGLISFIFFPLYQRFQYKRHYLKHIRETYRDRFDKLIKLTFTESSIEIQSTDSESKIGFDAIEEINEVEDYLFLKFKSGGSLIIPKRKLNHLDKINEEIKNLTQNYGITFNLYLNWQWK